VADTVARYILLVVEDIRKKSIDANFFFFVSVLWLNEVILAKARKVSHAVTSFRKKSSNGVRVVE
jgi:hypothetical protein